ncbi:MAG: branched-chain amino acid ABC transporter permease [Burkholderiaceae bacterium]|nr:branched-chain amino acid ABC transporter permease [Burkholderiaceae bacterium]
MTSNRNVQVHVAAAFALIAMPAVVGSFVLSELGSYAMILGLIALATMMLAGYGGIISLAQITVAGLAAYTVAILGENSTGVHGYGLPDWVNVPAALIVAVAFSTIVGAAAARTRGVYTIMITLAIAAAFFYFAMQNYSLFNGFSGYAGIRAPEFLATTEGPVRFYYLVLALAAAAYGIATYIADTPFGLAMQAIRDNEARARAVGFNVVAHKFALNAFVGLFSGIAGVLLVWFNGRISPGSIGVDTAIDILVITMIGGIRHPIGPFIGAVAFVLLKTFAIDLVGAERFNSLIAIVFLLIVFASPDGLVGLWRRIYVPRAAKG